MLILKLINMSKLKVDNLSFFLYLQYLIIRGFDISMRKGMHTKCTPNNLMQVYSPFQLPNRDISI